MRKKENYSLCSPIRCLSFAILGLLIAGILLGTSTLDKSKDEGIDLKKGVQTSAEIRPVRKFRNIEKSGGNNKGIESHENKLINAIVSSNDIPQKRKKKIAYAITVTKDGNFVDGALVLGYAATKFHDTAKGFLSEYDPELVAFVTKNVVTSRPILESFGWRILEKPLPVALEEIENKDYAERVYRLIFLIYLY